MIGSDQFLIDPVAGTTVRTPESGGAGSWVGAPNAYYADGVTYLSYRKRRPRGEGRGYETSLAQSKDGVTFSDIWTIPKEELGTSSIERCAITEGGDGYIFYVSYVDPADRRWCIDAMTARTVEGISAAVSKRVPVLRAEPLGLEAVKDPVVVRAAGLYWMYVSCASRTITAESISDSELHASEDVYTTGSISSETGLAVSIDGIQYEWLGMVFGVQPGRWDAYAARVSSFLRLSGVLLAFYDGSASVEENYEERTGLAVAIDPLNIHRVSVTNPWLTSPHASGSLRYLSAVRSSDLAHLYYEWACPDGSHELRCSTFNVADVASEGAWSGE